jgi:hypothetical protein
MQFEAATKPVEQVGSIGQGMSTSHRSGSGRMAVPTLIGEGSYARD